MPINSWGPRRSLQWIFQLVGYLCALFMSYEQRRRFRGVVWRRQAATNAVPLIIYHILGVSRTISLIWLVCVFLHLCGHFRQI